VGEFSQIHFDILSNLRFGVVLIGVFFLFLGIGIKKLILKLVFITARRDDILNMIVLAREDAVGRSGDI
jgi:hypothetical protein